MPTIARERLAGAYVLYDAQADDARLTLAIARTAATHGAAVVNYARVVEFVKHRHACVVGARVDVDGDVIDVRARCVVNATGVWADDVRALDEGVQAGVDPSGQGRAHHAAVGQGAQRHRRHRPRRGRRPHRLRGAVG